MVLDEHDGRSDPVLASLAQLDPHAYALYAMHLDQPAPVRERVGFDEFFQRIGEAFEQAEEAESDLDALAGMDTHFLLSVFSGGFYEGGSSVIVEPTGAYAAFVNEILELSDHLTEDHKQKLRRFPRPDAESLSEWIGAKIATSQAKLSSLLSVSDALVIDLGYRAVGHRYTASELVEYGPFVRTIVSIDHDAWTPPSDDDSQIMITSMRPLTERTSLAQVAPASIPENAQKLLEGIADERFAPAIEARLPFPYFREIADARNLYENGQRLESIFNSPEVRLNESRAYLEGLEPSAAERYVDLVFS